MRKAFLAALLVAGDPGPGAGAEPDRDDAQQLEPGRAEPGQSAGAGEHAGAAAQRAALRQTIADAPEHPDPRPEQPAEHAGPPLSGVEALLAAAEAAADVAAAVIRPFFRQGVAADAKSDASPVTIADRTAEQAMRAVLSQRFPEHGILGEEFGLDRPGARLRWVLDPVDGTRAFLTGRRNSAR